MNDMTKLDNRLAESLFFEKSMAGGEPVAYVGHHIHIRCDAKAVVRPYRIEPFDVTAIARAGMEIFGKTLSNIPFLARRNDCVYHAFLLELWERRLLS